MSEPTLISIDLIVRDPRLQSRVDPVDPEVARTYTTLYGDGPTGMDPIEVYRQSAPADGDERVWLTDGWTRLAAAETAGLREICAIIKTGSWRDALLASWEANGRHGARLTRADQRRKAEGIMSDPDLAGQPLRALEHRFNVGREVLRAVQADLEATGRSVRPETVTDSTGREQPAKKRGRPPGSKNKPKSAPDVADPDTAAEERRDVPPAVDTTSTRGWQHRASELQVRLRALRDEGIDEIDDGEGRSRTIAELLEDEDWLRPHVLDLGLLERLTAATEARLSEGAEVAPAAPLIQPVKRHELSGAITRPCYELLMHLRDAHVEQVGDPAQPGASWRIRDTLERLDKHLVSRQELLRISEAAEAAALKLPRSAAERRADSREDGKRRGRLIARLKQLAADGTTELGGAPTEYLRQVVPTMTEEQLARVEGLAFPEPEPQPQDADAVGALAVGGAEDVAELLNACNVVTQGNALLEALQRIEELEGALASAQADLVEAVQRASTREAELLDEIARLRATATAEASPPPAADPSGDRDPAWDYNDPKHLKPYLDLVGELPDAEIAAMAGMDVEAVIKYREVNKIPAHWTRDTSAPSTGIDLSKVDARLHGAIAHLGLKPDHEIARMFNSTPSIIGKLRTKLKIPAYKGEP